MNDDTEQPATPPTNAPNAKRGWRFGQVKRHRVLLIQALETYFIESDEIKTQVKHKEELKERLGICPKTLDRYLKFLDWGRILDERRKRFAPKIAQVDDAMFKAACRGDKGAAELCYQRFDGYIPTSKILGLEKRTDDELVDMAKAIVKELSGQEQEEGARGNSPGDSQEKAG